ncbi:hypothetical protein SAMN05216207_100332 [Pseudonocardia ammonioxydans]|uniref:Uncharacterized protein n=1 Tax=Pseudonocardia ammonioxydans TaxID=260086 RepID=A0A1I4TW05_PSUAM|nr:hypothetical protein SAMN05216207_100332 [Pseudonocardia ammonioxydans]
MPWAWAATVSPCVAACSTTSRSCATVYCDWNSLGPPGVIWPPPAITLIRSEDTAHESMAARISASVSAMPPRNQQCPPETVSGVPAARMRGVGAEETARSWSRTSATTPWASPRSRTVVQPERRHACAFARTRARTSSRDPRRTVPNGSGLRSAARCTWLLTRPGMMLAPGKLSRSAPGQRAASSSAGPTPAIRSPRTSTAARSRTSPTGPTRTRSASTMRSMDSAPLPVLSYTTVGGGRAVLREQLVVLVLRGSRYVQNSLHDRWGLHDPGQPPEPSRERCSRDRHSASTRIRRILRASRS